LEGGFPVGGVQAPYMDVGQTPALADEYFPERAVGHVT
jgi:hypothetical protein